MRQNLKFCFLEDARVRDQSDQCDPAPDSDSRPAQDAHHHHGDDHVQLQLKHKTFKQTSHPKADESPLRLALQLAARSKQANHQPNHKPQKLRSHHRPGATKEA